MLTKEVKRHTIRKGKFIGKVFLPKEWIGKRVIIKLNKSGEKSE